MNDEQIPDWLALTGTNIEARAVRMHAMLANGTRSLDDYFLTDTHTMGVRIERLNDHLTLLIGPFQHPTRSTEPAAIAGMMRAAFARAQQKGTAQISMRPMADVMQPALSDVLDELGFTSCGERIEFRSPVVDLPDDAGTPLVWKPISEVGETFAAQMFALASEGDPHGLAPDDVPSEIIAGYRSEAELTHGPDFIQVGFLNDEPVAFICAQTAPSDGRDRSTAPGPDLRRPVRPLPGGGPAVPGHGGHTAAGPTVAADAHRQGI